MTCQAQRQELSPRLLEALKGHYPTLARLFDQVAETKASERQYRACPGYPERAVPHGLTIPDAGGG